MAAFFRGDIEAFLATEPQAIIGQLSQACANAGFFHQTKHAIQAWEQEVAVLQPAFEAVSKKASVAGWSVLLEYPIPRRSKRIDVVLIAHSLIIVLEFKCGSSEYNIEGRR